MKQILPYTLIQIESPKIPIFHLKEVVKSETLFAKNDASSQSPIGCASLKTTLAFEVSFAFLTVENTHLPLYVQHSNEP